jgi:hypothetical protein
VSQHSTLAHSRTSVRLMHAKDLPAAVRREDITLEDFVRGVEKAFSAMGQERRSRFTRNVDLLGEVAQGTSIK